MSNQSIDNLGQENWRRYLLATASAAVLMIAFSSAARADDRPTMWLEGGWHYQAVKQSDELFLPDFVNLIPGSGLSGSPSSVQHVLAYSYGADGKVSFEPEGSDWIFSAAFTYGRAHGHRKDYAQTTPATKTTIIESVPALGILYTQKVPARAGKTVNFAASNAESHKILDFQAGKDVGIGIFRSGKAELSLGVRFAQFKSRSAAHLFLDPDFHRSTQHATYNVNLGSQTVAVYRQFPNQIWHNYYGSADIERGFRGIGPAISWNSSTSIAGNTENGAIDIDWGINAALLFGRQKSKVEHKTSAKFHDLRHLGGVAVYTTSQGPLERSRDVTVPNIGGFAGMSLEWANAKVSIGYRGDFFFGAIDGGIDTRHETTRGFYGPFASISVGVSPSDF